MMIHALISRVYRVGGELEDQSIDWKSGLLKSQCDDQNPKGGKMQFCIASALPHTKGQTMGFLVTGLCFASCTKRANSKAHIFFPSSILSFSARVVRTYKTSL